METGQKAARKPQAANARNQISQETSRETSQETSRETDEQALARKAARLIASGIYETVWQREKNAARKREHTGAPLPLPPAVNLKGQAWPLSDLEPLLYEGKPGGITLLDIHGGGFVEGTPYADDRLCAWYREQLGCTVISLDYRKAPLYPHPIPLLDIAAQIAWLVAERPLDLDPRRMVLMGHSAGGNLAAAYCLLAKQAKLPLPCAQVLDYPYLDLEMSCLERPKLPEAIEPLYMEVFRQAYRSGRSPLAPKGSSNYGASEKVYPGETGDGQSPRKENGAESRTPEQIAAEALRQPLSLTRPALRSPVLAAPQELAGLPPALLITCGRDSLGPEGQRYAELLRQAGVETTHLRLPDARHAFIEHTFNIHSRFSVDEKQKKLAKETMPKLAEWIAKAGDENP